MQQRCLLTFFYLLFHYTFEWKHIGECGSDCLVLFELLQQEVDGKTYYQFEFTAQARNYTRHALGVITVFNGIFHLPNHDSKTYTPFESLYTMQRVVNGVLFAVQENSTH